MDDDLAGYGGLVLEKLLQANIHVGDRVRVTHRGQRYEGTLMPRAQVGADPDHLVLKLDSGYNIGIRVTRESTVERVFGAKRHRRRKSDTITSSPDLPQVTILSTGGTIASRVDYRTGAVNPALTARDFYDAVPELGTYANISARVVMSKFSEDLTPADWTLLAKRIASEIRRGVDGVVVAHGTDTMGLTAAALSFALQNLPVPIVLVGSQRSSDRPSSDAAMNLIAATRVAAHADIAEVMLVMHGQTDDAFALAHRGSRARKCHTSRRDAFRSINASPLLKVTESEIVEVGTPLGRRDPSRRLRARPRFEPRVALLKTCPGLDGSVIRYLIEAGYKGLVIEGTGLGHAPRYLQPAIRDAVDAGMVVAMTSQCIWGRVDMNVYRSGVELLDIGVIPCEDMLPETALVKMMWLLANFRTPQRVAELLRTPLAGEISMRSLLTAEPTGGYKQ